MADQTKRPGWYPDPDGAAGERWWNGAGWSDSRRAGAAAAAASTSPYAAPTAVPPPIPVAGKPVIYSAGNPAPQRPDPYAQTPQAAQAVFSSTSLRSLDARINRNAFIGFIGGIISLFFNVAYLLAPVMMVFSIMGIVKARQLKAAGAPKTLMNFAVIGLAASAIAFVIALVSLVLFIISALNVNLTQ